jgi:hypothetical protein
MARIATLWPGGIRPRTATFFDERAAQQLARAMTTSSAGWSRM